MIIEINALDTLFFRDGKPFTMGAETWADGIFPPYPSVIYGALRSVYFAEHMEEFQKLKKEKNLDSETDPTTKLKIKGIFLRINGENCFPLPLNCVKEKNGSKDVCFALHPEPKNGFRSNYPDSLEEILSYSINDRTNKIENVPDAIFSQLDFKEYLYGSSEDFHYLKQNKYVLSEPKIGIARSLNTHTTEEGRLYRVDMRRLANKKNEKVSIVVNFVDLEIPDSGFLKLGGEGKAGEYKRIDKEINIEPPKLKEDEGQFKVVLTTPAIFENGWIPGWIDKETLIGEYNNKADSSKRADVVEVKLLAGAIGKPIPIGGFDMKAKKPKPMYNAVPAGSVYYFELRNGAMEEVKEVFHQTAISDVYSEQGFGICYVGKVEEHK